MDWEPNPVTDLDEVVQHELHLFLLTHLSLQFVSWRGEEQPLILCLLLGLYFITELITPSKANNETG